MSELPPSICAKRTCSLLPGTFLVGSMATKERSPNQTATAISLSKELFNAMEEARAALQMDRSNFIRYCIAKELKQLGLKVGAKH